MKRCFNLHICDILNQPGLCFGSELLLTTILGKEILYESCVKSPSKYIGASCLIPSIFVIGAPSGFTR